MLETRTVMLTVAPGDPPQPVEVPLRVGAVKIGEKLGEGAVGAVFLGFDESLGRPVAVKFLHRQRAAGAAAQEELISGVRAAAGLRHPRIVTVHSVGAQSDLPYVVMEFVDGLSLRQLLTAGGAFELELGLHVFRNTASAVAVLHEAGVLHRDLKPANILIDRQGEVRVCDFGLACPFDPRRLGPGSTAIGGTPLYMAPEVFAGPGSPQADVYALGVMLYEMLAGQPPFRSDSMQELRHLHESAAPPWEELEAARVPDGVLDLVQRAMHKQRHFRHKSAGHLVRALDELGLRFGPEHVLARQIVERLMQAQGGSAAPPEAAPATPELTTFDLVARRAREKRGRP